VDVLILTVFVSLVLVVAGLIFFASRLRDGDLEHADRLSLLPIAEDERPVVSPSDEKNEPGVTNLSRGGEGAHD